MIKINNIPCGYQNMIPEPIAFILLHKLIDNEEYREHYLDESKEFSLIILDNSCFELGESLNDELLIGWACKLKSIHPDTPIEIVIPDSYGDKDKTLSLMREFLTIDTTGFDLMVVPQGKNEKELLECLFEMLQETEISCIGLNKLWDKHMIEKIAPIINRAGKQIHRLGVHNLSDWVLDCEHYIRSADSRILAKLVTGNNDPWEEKLNQDQLDILYRLIKEVDEW